MKKVFEKAASCTKKLSVINGMYPSVSCNHRMRAAGHQLDYVAECEQINWKSVRLAKKEQSKLLTEFSNRVFILLENRAPRPARVRERELGSTKTRFEGATTKLADAVRGTNLEEYQKLRKMAEIGNAFEKRR